MNFVFWNLNRKPLEKRVANLVRNYNVDVLMLAECEVPVGRMLLALNPPGHAPFDVAASLCKRLVTYTRFSSHFLRAVQEQGDRISIRRLNVPARREIFLGVVHLPSKLYWSDKSQCFECERLADWVRKLESECGHRRTVLVGDFNVNPFEEGVVAARGLNAVMTKAIASRGTRVVQEEEYPFFCNPMWSRHGDGNDGPPGTYYRQGSEHVEYYWHMFDQVLVRPDLLPHFDVDSLKVLDNDGDSPLVSESGTPDRNAGSDHLPLFFKLDW